MKFCGRSIEVKTLTVAQFEEYRKHCEEAGDGKKKKRIHIFDLAFRDPEIDAFAVSMATGLTLDDLAGPYIPQDGKDLLDKVRALNPFFVGMMEAVNAAVENGQVLVAPSSKPSMP